MAVAVNGLLTAVGLMVVAAFLAMQGFRKWRLPDAFALILLGAVAGPVLGLVDVATFAAVMPVVGTVAIIMILFDGGREVRFHELGTGVASGTGLAFLVFGATSLLGAGVALLAVEPRPDPAVAALLGMTFGGAGAVVALPLIQRLRVRPGTVTVVAVEAAVSDALVALGVVGLSTALLLHDPDPAVFARLLFVTFSMGITLGLAVGWAWGRVLPKVARLGYGYVLTLAVLFLVYAVTDTLGGSGALAALACGVVVGNARHDDPAERARAPRRGDERGIPVFDQGLASFHAEALFFVRAFFFTALGVTLDVQALRDPGFLLVGALLAAAVVLGRYWGVMLLFWRKGVAAWDRAAMAAMFPLGLAAAVLSQVPWQRFGIPGTERFPSYAAVVILVTNAAAGLAVWVLERPKVRARFEHGPPPKPPASGRRRRDAGPAAPRLPGDPPGAPGSGLPAPPPGAPNEPR